MYSYCFVTNTGFKEIKQRLTSQRLFILLQILPIVMKSMILYVLSIAVLAVACFTYGNCLL